MKTYTTTKTQIELLPRITILYKKGLAVNIEWLWFGIYFGKIPKFKMNIDNEAISYFAESYASFYFNPNEDTSNWKENRRAFRSGMLQSIKYLNGDKYTIVL
jgi:hypothetical protein